MQDYLKMFMNKLDFPKEATETFLDVNLLFEQNSNLKNEMDLIINRFYSDFDKYEEILSELNVLAQKTDIHPYTLHFLFFIFCSKILMDKYKEKDISIDIFWNSMLDLRCKLLECHKIHNIWGTFVGFWFSGFFAMNRFGLGRLQYECVDFPYDAYTKGRFTVNKGDRVFNVHIPSSGPLTYAERLNSYKMAYEFYKNELVGKPMVLVCRTWLFYKKNEEFYPKGSNIIDFMHDFDITESYETDTFEDAWRIFGKDNIEPIEELPADTSLQRAYKKWLKDGNKTGMGYGVMLFDGEQIIK